MPRQLHGVVQHPANHQQSGLNAVDQEVARPSHYASSAGHVIATQPQVPGSNAATELRALDASWPVRPGGHVAKRRDDQAFVAQPRHLAEFRVCSDQDNVRAERGVCAQHGRELMGCKSPVGVPIWTQREQG